MWVTPRNQAEGRGARTAAARSQQRSLRAVLPGRSPPPVRGLRRGQQRAALSDRRPGAGLARPGQGDPAPRPPLPGNFRQGQNPTRRCQLLPAINKSKDAARGSETRSSSGAEAPRMLSTVTPPRR